jgi:hypothetical protein
MDEGTCEWAGCNNNAEGALEGRPLCRTHFYEIGTKRIEQIRDSLQQTTPSGSRDIAILKFVSELISQTTNLVVQAKFLSPWQRDQLRDLSWSALELYKRIHRNQRVPLSLPIILFREAGIVGNQELTNTVNISKRGACIATISACVVDERIWIQKTTSPLRTLARVAWTKKNGPSQYLAGIELLEHKNFWGLESITPIKNKQ